MSHSPKVLTLPTVARSPGAARLRSAREALGLSQEAAGQLRGISARQVRKLENNESPNDGLELLAELEARLATKRAA